MTKESTTLGSTTQGVVKTMDGSFTLCRSPEINKDRITSDMSVQDIFKIMSEGNAGAYTACWELLENTERVDPDGRAFGGMFSSILKLDTLGIYGDRLAMLWSDVCGRDVTKMIAVLRACSRQLAGVNKETLNHAISNYGAGINLDDVMKEVKNRYPNFNSVATAT